MKKIQQNQGDLLQIKSIQNFRIVGIGASAGGLDAFKRLLTEIPENTGMAFVLVQHLDPSHESILPEILQRVTKIPVIEITDDIPLAPDHIYIIPSNKMLTSTDGVLKLTDREKRINLSIDIFFTSLAKVHQELAVGIVLSGSGTDGTVGLKAIKEYGGITIAQDRESATYDSMPQSAINAGVVDFILAPEKIPEQLLLIDNLDKTTTVSSNREPLPKTDEAVFKQILLILRQSSGVDFTYYKFPTLHRRITRRIAIVKKKNIADYLKFLRIDKAEQEALFLDVIIPVTSFFRDPKTFQALTDIVFPGILKNKVSDDPIRIWIAGCSTGEEAFSIAISLHQYLTSVNLAGTKIQIFASDISEKAIKIARTAIYNKADVEKITENQLATYFTKNNSGYDVNKLIRDMCVFAPHNFLKDPPFAKMDFVTCRNVLIYMDTFLQKKAFTTFHYSLKENGFLLLGKSETIGTASDLFLQVNKNEKIYTRKPSIGRFVHSTSQVTGGELASRQALITSRKNALLVTNVLDFKKSAEAVMIIKSPANVVVNDQSDIVHIHGDIAPFLQAPQGKPTHNLIKMAREGLAFELRNALHKASKEKKTIVKENIPFIINQKQALATIEIVPLTDTIEPHYLVLFENKVIPNALEESKSESVKVNEKQKQNLHLENELSQTREDMRYITEDMEAANEELQSANEELQSSNEEMQSLNEELETSKEELQSTNEELIIVNQEMLDKQEQLNQSYVEQVLVRKQIEASEKRFSNILSQSLMAIAILKGSEMVVNFANEQIIAIWGKGPNVIGKPLLEILPEIKDQVFPQLLKDVYTTGIHFVTNEIKCILNRNNKDEECYFNLIYQPYRDVDDKITGITIIATETTEQVLAKKQIEANEIEKKRSAWHLKLATDSANVGIWSLDIATNKLEWSRVRKIMWGYDENREDLTYEHWHNVIVEKDKKLAFEKIEEAKNNHTIYEVEYRIIRPNDGAIAWIKSTGQYHYDEFGVAHTLTGISIDISKQKKYDEELFEAKYKAEIDKEIAENATLAKQQFLSNMSHEIRTPMNAIIGFTKVMLKTDLSDKQKEYLQAIKSSGNTLIVLINDILDLAKVDAGKMIFTAAPFKIADSIAMILHLFETKFQEGNLELVKRFDAKIPEIVLGDSVRLHQILINLVSNAIKFTTKGTITVSVVLISEDDKKVNLEISVADTGIGIPENKIDAIFENFEQATNVTSSLYGGTGLGLAIVKQLVEKQGGTISVVSKINEGSTFSFQLSFQKTSTKLLVENELVLNVDKSLNVKVLVVEDVKLNQLLMRTILDDFNFQWDMADNGQIAIDKLKTNTFDIILMDLQMPIMNGFEATKYIRNEMKLTIPIIALTADVTSVDLEKCKEAGMNDYISKPLDEKILFGKIAELMKSK